MSLDSRHIFQLCIEQEDCTSIVNHLKRFSNNSAASAADLHCLHNGILAIVELTTATKKNERASEHRIHFAILDVLPLLLQLSVDCECRRSSSIVAALCVALHQLSIDQSNQHTLGALGVVEIILDRIIEHQDNKSVILVGLAALAQLAHDNMNIQSKIGASGGISLVFLLLRCHGYEYNTDDQVASSGLQVLSLLTMTSSSSITTQRTSCHQSWWANQEIALGEKNVRLLIERLRSKHSTSHTVTQYANTLMNSMYQENQKIREQHTKDVALVLQEMKVARIDAERGLEVTRIKDALIKIIFLMKKGLLSHQELNETNSTMSQQIKSITTPLETKPSTSPSRLNSSEVIYHGCRTMLQLCSPVDELTHPTLSNHHKQYRKILGSNGAMACLLSGLVNYGVARKDLTEKGLWALRNMSLCPENMWLLIDNGGVQLVLELLEHYSGRGACVTENNNVRVVRNGTSLLWFLAKSTTNTRQNTTTTTRSTMTTCIAAEVATELYENRWMLLQLLEMWCEVDQPIETNVHGVLECCKMFWD